VPTHRRAAAPATVDVSRTVSVTIGPWPSADLVADWARLFGGGGGAVAVEETRCAQCGALAPVGTLCGPCREVEEDGP